MQTELAYPMYDISPPATDALAAALRRRFPGAHFSRPDALLASWQDDALLLSQACGYPMVTRLHDVQVVGCFHYLAPGCSGPDYRSLLVARAGDSGARLDAFRDRPAAANAPDSQSGYRALLRAVGGDTGYFSRMVWCGSHRGALRAVRRGEADLAAIDCVSFALLARYFPQEVEGLAVIDETPLTPGLPLITSRTTPPPVLAALREALGAVAEDRAIAGPLLIGGFSPVRRSTYAPLAAAIEPRRG